ncbi:MAG: hypothetical protein O7G84_01310, partial [Gammaproteobacteria bacterium]|nr:hypothetical protein [Gammaproteobacteria bacterium]
MGVPSDVLVGDILGNAGSLTNVIVVDGGTSIDPPDQVGTSLHPYGTIQQGIDAAELIIPNT